MGMIDSKFLARTVRIAAPIAAIFAFTVASMMEPAVPMFSPAPYGPRATQPDYVVTMVVSDGGKVVGRRTVKHHGNWTRVDQDNATAYSSANGIANISIDSEGSVSLKRGDVLPGNLETEWRNTGERQAHLGETCTVRDVWRTKGDGPSGSVLTHFSCITDDGIELSQQTTSNLYGAFGSAEVEHLERRPVAPDEVQPPPTLLTLDWWDRSPSVVTAQSVPDHETIMELSGYSARAEKGFRTTRRHGPWLFVEETVDDTLRNLKITHDSERMWLDYVDDARYGPKRLSIMRAGPAPTSVPLISPPKDMDHSEVVLGETCRWHDMHPDISDLGESSCLTNDGIALKHRILSRTRSREWTAIRFARRPVGLDEIKPPAEILDPKLWGIE